MRSRVTSWGLAAIMVTAFGCSSSGGTTGTGGSGGHAGTIRESAKYEMFFELLEKQLEGGHRVLVFSQFTSMLALLAQGLKQRKVAYAELTGATLDRAARLTTTKRERETECEAE